MKQDGEKAGTSERWLEGLGNGLRKANAGKNPAERVGETLEQVQSGLIVNLK